MGVRKKLEEEFDSLMLALDSMEANDEDYTKILNNAIRISEQLGEIQKLNDNYDLKKMEILSNSENREKELQLQKNRSKLEWGKIAVPSICAITMGVVSMIWEKTDTLTSTAGKNALRDIISFKLFK